MNARILGLALGVAGLTACNPAARFDSTWLFWMGSDADYSGTCIEGVDLDAQPIVTGETAMEVDIFAAEDGRVVVFFEEVLVGPIEDGSFNASWSQTVVGTDYSFEDRLTMDATRDGDTLTGTVTSFSEDTDVDGTENCSTVVGFTAERIVSDEDKYLGD